MVTSDSMIILLKDKKIIIYRFHNNNNQLVQYIYIIIALIKNTKWCTNLNNVYKMTSILFLNVIIVA